MSVCVSVCLFVPSPGTRNRMDWRLLVKECIVKIAKKNKNLSWQTSLLCILGELAGEESVAVTVCLLLALVMAVAVAVGFIGFINTLRTRQEIQSVPIKGIFKAYLAGKL